MKNLTTKKLMAIFVTSVLASLVVPMALAGHTPATPVIPNPAYTNGACVAPTGTSWTAAPIINAKMTVKNDEDSGFIGYWALDNYVKSFVIWEATTTGEPISGTPETFCVLEQYAGTWTTFAGALSPMTGAVQPFGGSGLERGSIVYNFTGTWMGLYCKPTKHINCGTVGTYSTEPLTGSIGKYNFGGTQADIMKGSYGNGQTGLTACTTGTTQGCYTDFISFYFSGSSSYTYNDGPWSWVYSFGGGAGYGNLWVNSNGGSFGDIVT